MKIYKEFEKSKGFCEKCKTVVSATFKLGILEFNGAKIPDVLQEYCDECGCSIGIPQQSSVKIKEFHAKQRAKELTMRVPSHLVDVLFLIGTKFRVSSEPNTVWRIISDYYFEKMKEQKQTDIRVFFDRWLKDDLALGRAGSRLSFRFDNNTYGTMKKWARMLNANNSSIMRGIIVAAKHELLDGEDKNGIKEFEQNAFMMR